MCRHWGTWTLAASILACGGPTGGLEVETAQTGEVSTIVLHTEGEEEFAGLLRQHSFFLDRKLRTFISYRPRPEATNRPLVMLLHGGTGSARGMFDAIDLRAYADAFDVDIVYPQGTVSPAAGLGHYWNDGRGLSSVDDLRYLDAIIDIGVRWKMTDPGQIFMSGISNGASMTFHYACTHPGKLAGIAPVINSIPEAIADACEERLLGSAGRAAPTALLHVGGTADPAVPWEGGQIIPDENGDGRGAVIPFWQASRLFAEHNGCADRTTTYVYPDADPNDGTTLIRYDFTACSSGNLVSLLKMEGAGHTWPDPDASMAGWYQDLVGPVNRDYRFADLLFDFISGDPAGSHEQPPGGGEEEGSCANVDCGGHGSCVLVNETPTCFCDAGFASSGLSCLDPCAAAPCDSSAHGSCEVVGSEASCVCDQGYVAQGLECVEDPACVCTGKCAGADDGCGGTCVVDACASTCCDAVCCEDGQICDVNGACVTPWAPPFDDPTGGIHPRRAALWMEGHAGDSALPYSAALSRPVVVVVAGLAKHPDAYNYKLIHGNWQPRMTEAQIRTFVRDAISKEGYAGVALDHEGWTLLPAYRHILRWMYEEAEAAGGKFINAPKITLDHHVNAWGISAAEVIREFERYTHATMGWIYNFEAAQYRSIIQTWRHYGYTKLIWAVGDFGRETTNLDPQYLTTPQVQRTIIDLANSSPPIPFCLFSPLPNSSHTATARSSRLVLDTMATYLPGGAPPPTDGTVDTGSGGTNDTGSGGTDSSDIDAVIRQAFFDLKGCQPDQAQLDAIKQALDQGMSVAEISALVVQYGYCP